MRKVVPSVDARVNRDERRRLIAALNNQIRARFVPAQIVLKGIMVLVERELEAPMHAKLLRVECAPEARLLCPRRADQFGMAAKKIIQFRGATLGYAEEEYVWQARPRGREWRDEAAPARTLQPRR